MNTARCLCWAFVVLSLVASRGHAQSRPTADARREAALSARLTRNPDDTQALCEMGFQHIRANRAATAIPLLDHAITTLGEPTTSTLRRRLAACLYNRGLAASRLGDDARARTDYRRSLGIRPNGTTELALARLSETSTPVPIPSPSSTVLAAARAACERDAPGTRCAPIDGDFAHRPPAGECDDGTRWSIVEMTTANGNDTGRLTVAVAEQGTTVTTAIVHRQSDGEAMPSYGVSAALRTLAADRCGLAIETTFEWVVPSMEGAFDCGEYALSVLYFTGDTLWMLTLPTYVYDESDHFHLLVDLDGRGNLVVRADEGEPSQSVTPFLGTHTLDSLATSVTTRP